MEGGLGGGEKKVKTEMGEGKGRKMKQGVIEKDEGGMRGVNTRRMRDRKQDKN